MNEPGTAPAKTILVVDDEKAVCQVMSLALGRAGYGVVTADAPKAAIAAMRAHACRVVFIDLNLPGTSGLDLCRIIKPEHPHTMVYLLTGYAPESAMHEFRAAGFRDLLIKPVDLKVLAAVVHEAFAVELTAGVNLRRRHPRCAAGRYRCEPA